MIGTAVIGTGAVCRAGRGVGAGWSFVSDGGDGLTPLALFDAGLKQPPLCAQLPFDPATMLDKGLLHNRTLGCSVLAADEAMGEVGPRIANRRLGLVVATSVAGMARSERFLRTYLLDKSMVTHVARELSHHEPTTVTAELARRYGANPAFTVSTACSTGVHAVGMAKRMLDLGRCEFCLAVGADVLSLLTVRGFASLVLLAPDGCRPFDKARAGISLGEGAGAVLLASERAVDALGATPLAYVRGWGASADCHHMTAPHPEGTGAAASLRAALREARLAPADIDCVAAHGTGTPDNDAAEGRALREVFGDVPPFYSMKRSLGHTLAASGILETVFGVEALREGVVPPTAGFETLDEQIGAAPSPRRDMRIRHMVKNAFGFGGNNASLVISEAADT